jgi:hypothetical protein
MVVSADVADRDQMQRVFARTLERFSALHGVVHTAGRPGTGLMHQNRGTSSRGVGAEVRGTSMLATLLHSTGSNDFWLALFGAQCNGPDYRQVDYCRQCLPGRVRGRRWQHPQISINWGVAGAGHD